MIKEAAELIRKGKRVTAFTGAGISVESGIPPFRGPEGLWNRYDPKILEINYFRHNPEQSWMVIKKIFYDFFGTAKFNKSHKALAVLEEKKLLSSIITQNIDNLHQEAGSRVVHEYHGNSKRLVCMDCGEFFPSSEIDLNSLPPLCSSCGSGLLKPDFIFFGEPIPEPAGSNSIDDAERSDVFLIIGTSGEIMPASMIPYAAKKNNSKIIEINTERSSFTNSITDIFLQGKATETLSKLLEAVLKTPLL
ncbi:MAG: NAD-dependent deacylase [Acidobacteriota bacterium]